MSSSWPESNSGPAPAPKPRVQSPAGFVPEMPTQLAALPRRVLVAAARLTAALGLWRGDAYGEFEGTPALHAEGDRLRRIRLAALEDRIEAELATGLGTELVAELETLVERHPGHERLWGLLMTALYRAGRQVDALQAFRRARAALAETSGVLPSPALTELHRQVLAQDDHHLLPARPTRPPRPLRRRHPSPSAPVRPPAEAPRSSSSRRSAGIRRSATGRAGGGTGRAAPGTGRRGRQGSAGGRAGRRRLPHLPDRPAGARAAGQRPPRTAWVTRPRHHVGDERRSVRLAWPR